MNLYLHVNVLEYREVSKDGNLSKFSRIKDFENAEENAIRLMRAARARWRTENETFNTLKNRGYNLGHNYGLARKNVNGVFAIMIMQAFLIALVQQMSCWLLQKAYEKAGSKWFCGNQSILFSDTLK